MQFIHEHNWVRVDALRMESIWDHTMVARMTSYFSVFWQVRS